MCGCCARVEERDEWDRWVRETVSRAGWAVVAVTGATPHAYTIGLWHSYELPELAMFGLRSDDMQVWLNECARLLRHSGDLGDEVPLAGVIEGYPVLLRRMHPSWHRSLFARACSYYGVDEMPVRQVVWPDRDGRWPWDEAATANCREGQPLGWLPVGAHPDGGWRLVGEMMPTWPFPELQPDTVVMASSDVVAGVRGIVAVTHDAEGEWDFLDERGYADEATGWVHFGRLYRAYPWLMRFADLPRDTLAWLDEDGQWHQRRFSAEVEPVDDTGQTGW
jgi:uncharacterized protein DUF4262